ncbi:MAG TPA: sigma-70 family RNA polymerase sigma factor, partial [Candidatus Binatia bacterium]|nr:sigma-70 family RNA polymerase sigma factor [Candidatus Binatia bacterium]
MDDKLPAPEPATVEAPAPAGALVPQDPLSTYLAEIRRYPVLSREEEHELAVRYFEHEDEEAAYRLITSNLRLVVMIAREYQRAFHNLLDLVQEGNVGLLEAVKKFDPYRGVRLPSYAVWWIRAYIIRYIMNNFRLVKVGTTQAQRRLFFNLQKEKARLESEGFA